MSRSEVALGAMALVCFVALVSMPPALPVEENEQTSTATVTIQTVVSFAIKGAMTWTNVSKGQKNIPVDGTPYVLTIRSATNVNTKIQFNASDLTVSKPYQDNTIEDENFKIWQTGTGSGLFVDGDGDGYKDIPWLTNIPPPGATDNNIYVYPSIDTSDTQLAGTYTGTFGFKAVEL